jgi:hypothetical protein
MVMSVDVTAAFAGALPRWKESPASMVRELFGVEPDAWQVGVLEAFPRCQRQAMQACKGPGKTALLSWLAWNFMLTRPFPKIAATSVTGDNLSDNLWAEMAKWQGRSRLLGELFSWTRTRIASKQYPETWFMSARTWPKSGDPKAQADTLAGLHADYIMFLLDESGGIPDAVMATAEAGLSSCVEGHIVQAGNPTMLSGPLYRAATRDRHLWHVTEITGDPDSPLRSSRVSAEWARQQIEMYGAENPWVLVNVYGRFPPSSLNVLLGLEDVMAAVARRPEPLQYEHEARVMGIDVARFGDDASVLVRRQGVHVDEPRVWRNMDSVAGAANVALVWSGWDADACFVDDTGGYGSGWIDNLRRLGRTPMGIAFSGKALNGKYLNKRAEMWFNMAEWVKAGGSLPNVPELIADLTEPTYTFRADKLMIEDKDQIKARLGRSPDWGDALALTFAYPIAGRARGRLAEAARKFGITASRDYDPWQRDEELLGAR